MNPIINNESAVQRLQDLRREGAAERRRPSAPRRRRVLKVLRAS